jgi:hypothetical protein
MKNETDNGYNKDLLQLLTTQENETYSHWFRSDNIVFCPKHLYEYVEKNYAEIFV